MKPDHLDPKSHRFSWNWGGATEEWGRFLLAWGLPRGRAWTGLCTLVRERGLPGWIHPAAAWAVLTIAGARAPGSGTLASDFASLCLSFQNTEVTDLKMRVDVQSWQGPPVTLSHFLPQQLYKLHSCCQS
jgi:hypothetical protein